MEAPVQNSSTLAQLTAQVAAAYVANHRVPLAELADVIAIIGTALNEVGREMPKIVTVAPLVPAVPIKKSVTPGYLICLDDGKRFKFLKRHLSKLGMTPDEYRRKWNLPSDYPMVSADYAARRTAIALSFGLGRKKITQPETAVSAKPKRLKKAAA